MPEVVRVSSRNDTFQILSTYLTNRTKRRRAGLFLVQGVRPVTQALAAGWELDALVLPRSGPRSAWGRGVVADARRRVDYVLDDDLFGELAERGDGAELIAVARTKLAAVADVLASPAPVVVVLDRPHSPGNLGTVIRAVDALGAGGVVVTGHACDPFDPQCVRATTGSIFGVPVAEAASLDEVLTGDRVVVAADERGEDLRGFTFPPRATLLFGNETTGLAGRVRDAVTTLAIPMAGTASSLNLANSVSIFLYAAIATPVVVSD